MGELKDVLIKFYFHPSIHEVIDIYIVDIPELYGNILIRDWLTQLRGYFSIDWSHMLIPRKSQNEY